MVERVNGRMVFQWLVCLRCACWSLVVVREVGWLGSSFFVNQG
jgi:hypothetical protein